MLLNIGETKTQRQVWSGIQGGGGSVTYDRHAGQAQSLSQRSSSQEGIEVDGGSKRRGGQHLLITDTN